MTMRASMTLTLDPATPSRPITQARDEVAARALSAQWAQMTAESIYSEALAPFVAEAQRLLPYGVEVFDAHTHLGLDEDGRSLDLATLLAQLDDAGARRACVFPLHDPERRPAYSLPNDRVLAWAGESEGRLIPFCRLDPAETPV